MPKAITKIRYREGLINKILRYRSGKTKSVWIKDLTGLKVGRLTVISLVDNCEDRIEGAPIRWSWLCKCECGKESKMFANNIGRGHSNSCGCLGFENRTKSVTTHGLGHTVEYQRWFAMISRCHNPNHKANKLYKKEKRTVCGRWRNSFECFLEDVGIRPNGLTLERGDNNQGYHCGKCAECISKGWVRNGHWDSWEAQSANKLNNRFFEYNGVRKIARDWAKEFNFKPTYVLYGRLMRGWSMMDAIKVPVKKFKNA